MGLIVSDKARAWPGGVAYFHKAPGGRAPTLWTKFQAATRMITSVTPIKLVIRDGPGDGSVAVYRSSSPASSDYGKTTRPGEQWMSYADSNDVGTVAHEIMHVLGVLHEHQRPDRDTHLRVDTAQIRPGYLHHFSKLLPSEGVPVGAYDYASIMHVRPHLHAISSLPTILPTVDGAPAIGQREGLSQGDIASLAELYGFAKPATAVIEAARTGVAVVVPGYGKHSERVGAPRPYYIEVTNLTPGELKLRVEDET